ncbi:hypothetical protein D3C77_356270 [compost metagenome]
MSPYRSPIRPVMSTEKTATLMMEYKSGTPIFQAMPAYDPAYRFFRSLLARDHPIDNEVFMLKLELMPIAYVKWFCFC